MRSLLMPSPAGPDGALESGARRFLVLVWGYTLAYVLLLLLRLGSANRVPDDIGFLPLYLAAGVGALAGASSSGAPPRDRWGWRLAAWAWLTSLLGAVAWIPSRAMPELRWLDPAAWLLYNVYFPLLVGGLLLFAAAPEGRRARLILLVEALIVLVVSRVLSWYFLFTGAAPANPLGALVGGWTVNSVAEPVVLLTATVALHRPARLGGARALQLVGLAAFAASVGDGLVEQSTRFLSDPALRQAGSMAIALGAATFASAGVLRRASSGRPPIRLGRQQPVASVLPYAAISVLGALILLELDTAGHAATPLPGLAVGASILTALVIARLLLAQRDLAEEAAAREAQDVRFRGLVHRSSEALLIAAEGGAIRYASPAAAALLGVSESTAVGLPLAGFAGPADRDSVVRALADPRDGTTLRWTVGPDGGTREVESVLTDLRADPAVGGVVLNTRDVTERNRLEKRLRQSQKLDALGLLAGGIAHDFNNLLAAIRGNADLLALDTHHRAGPEVSEIQRAAERGASLCRQLLAFSRAGEPVRAPVDLAVVTQELTPMLRRVLPSSVELVVLGTAGRAGAMADRVQLESALVNLAVNARDAMPSGGVLTVETDVVDVTAGDAWSSDGIPSGRYAALSVRDTGTGMDEETRTRAFEPFFTTKPQGKGTGLGLSTVHGIVTGHGGRVRIESAPGRGTAVTALFPLHDGALAGRSAPSEPEKRETARGRILLAEDDAGVRSVCTRYLTLLGYEVFAAVDGLEALRELEALDWRVDLLLTDLTMPHLGGVDLVQRVRAARPDLPVVCMTGRVAEILEADGGALEGVAKLAKPFGLEELRQILRQALRGTGAAAS